MKHPTEAEILTRAAPPEVLYPSDLRIVLQLQSEEEALGLLAAGELGPTVRIGGRLAILRRALMSHLGRAGEVRA